MAKIKKLTDFWENNIKRFIKCIMLTMMTAALIVGTAAPASAYEVEKQPDGSEIEYFKDITGKVFKDLPYIIETSTTNNGSKTVKYQLNQISNDGEVNAEHKIMDTDSYMTVNNVIKESTNNGYRLLFVKGPVTIQYHGYYYQSRRITRNARTRIENGRVLYDFSYNLRTQERADEDIMYDITTKDQTEILDKPGMYIISDTKPVEDGLSIEVYVTYDENDTVTKPLTTENATPTNISMTINGKSSGCPAYSIDGESYVRYNDMAYILRNTSKNFNTPYDSRSNTLSIITDDSYKPTGKELAKLSTGVKKAVPTKKHLVIDATDINPFAYDIDGITFIKLDDLASIDDFSITSGSTKNLFIIDTSKGYSLQGSKQKAEFKAASVERLCGDDRYKTAVAISKKGWDKADNVVLASGTNFTDALAGSSFAYLKDAPILLTASDKLNEDTSAEIQRLGAKNVYILGSITSISSDIENALMQTYNVERIGGEDVMDTAVKVAEKVKEIKPFDTIILATQENFPDALAAATFSAKNTIPILFTRPDDMRADTMKIINDYGIKNVLIAGGTGVVSSVATHDIYEDDNIKMKRLWGETRYDTAIEIAKNFEDTNFADLAIVTGENYPDALAGAVLAAKNNMPLILVNKGNLNSAVKNYLYAHTMNKVYIFGGTGVVPDDIVGTN